MIKKILYIAGKLLMFLSIIYIGVYLYNTNLNWELVRDQKLFILILIFGSFFSIIAIFILGILWGNILRLFSTKKIALWDAVGVYTKANMGKYLPGNIMHYVERNLFASKAGIGQAETALSSVLEIVLEILSAVLIAVLFLHDELKRIMESVTVGKYFWFLILLIPIIIIVLLNVVQKNRVINIGLKKISTPFKSKKFLPTMLQCILGYSSVFIIYGLILLVILVSVLQCHLTWGQCGKVISGFILAWLIGFIVPGAPGGIGIREFVLITIMTSFVAEQYILFAVILHRIITVIGDLLTYIIFHFILRKA